MILLGKIITTQFGMGLINRLGSKDSEIMKIAKTPTEKRMLTSKQLLGVKRRFSYRIHSWAKTLECYMLALTGYAASGRNQTQRISYHGKRRVDGRGIRRDHGDARGH
jgi:hypothetical protein